MSKSAIHIGIFDDHQILAAGLRALLENQGFSVAFTANSKASLLAELQANSNIHVLITDVMVPDAEGMEVFATVSQHFPTINILAYTSLTSPMTVENLLISGAKGFLNKRQPETDMVAAIEALAKGEVYVPEMYQFLLEKVKKQPNKIELTSREKEVLGQILKGRISKEIADTLGMSKNTVDNHRAKLFQKFQVQNVAELISAARDLGYSEGVF